MGTCDVQAVIAEVELLLNEEELTDHIELAIEKLLNVVETLSADKKALADEVDRICKKLGEKNKKTTANPEDQADGDDQESDSNHSSEKRRCKRSKKLLKKRRDRRSFKDLTMHDTVKCPVDPATLPPDAVRADDEIVIV